MSSTSTAPSAEVSAIDPIACLGPVGSFCHLVASKRFPDRELKLLNSVEEVFDWLQERPEAHGIVPIENSSGGIIIATIDRLMHPSCKLKALQELTLDVKLALLGRKGETVETIYSHPMPFFHCDDWLHEHFPHAKRVPLPSTSHAATQAANTPGGASLGFRGNAERNGLDVLFFPINGDIPNITQFFLLGTKPSTEAIEAANRSALVVDLPDKPGILCSFLTPLSQSEVSLKRIESRPVRGHPNTYRFYIEIEGSRATPRVAKALDEAAQFASSIRLVGEYHTGIRYES